VPAGKLQVPFCEEHFIQLATAGAGSVRGGAFELSAATASSIKTALTVKHDTTTNSKTGICFRAV